MKTIRVLIAGIVGGVLFFMWGAFVHMVLPVGKMGISNLPGEDAVVQAMKSSITQPGFYIFPAYNDKATATEQEAWTEKYKANPAGVVIYKPVGGEMLSPRLLGTECVSNVLAALIGAIVICCAGGGFARGAGVGLAIGLFGWMNLDVSYWNWYGFPLEMIEGSLIEQGAGWLIIGGIIGLIVGVRKRLPQGRAV